MTLSLTKSVFVDGVYLELLRAFLPAGVLDYFDVVAFDQKGERMTLSLEEKNELPEVYRGQPYHSKGFTPPVSIEDFPIRGQRVLLQVKRRRWEHTDSGEIVTRDWSMVQKGTKMTAEFAAFLKQVLG